MPEPAPRPIQVTVAGWLVMVGSVFVVLAAFDQVAGLHTRETREAVERFLDGTGRGLGLDVQGTLSLMRVLSMVAAACATAAAILGYQVLRRSRSARLVLSVLAVPLFLIGLMDLGSAGSGFFSAVVAGAIVMLWFQPARDWMDGRAPRPAPVPPPLPPIPGRSGSATSSGQTTLPPDAGPGSAPGPAPRPMSGFGGRGSLLDSLPPPTTPPLGAQPGPQAVGTGRPPALVWACALTWCGAGLAAFLMLASIVAVLAAPDLMMDELYRQNPSFEEDGVVLEDIRTSLLVVGGLVVLWSCAAMVAAGFLWARRSWAWRLLLVLSSTATVACMAGSFGGALLLLPLLPCAATTILLVRPDVRASVR